MSLVLDLCCGAGGASEGYTRAGHVVVGVDISAQPNYPFEFIQEDALWVLQCLWQGGHVAGYGLEDFNAIHASFPCQRWTAYARKGYGVGDGYPDLITPGRELLRRTGLPYVIENVPDAPLENPVELCGSSFGLDVRRHRNFETNWPLLRPPCWHAWQKPRFPGATNRKPNSRRTVEIGVWRIPLDVQKRAMGIDREITRKELSESIPPAYTELIGWQLMERIK